MDGWMELCGVADTVRIIRRPIASLRTILFSFKSGDLATMDECPGGYASYFVLKQNIHPSVEQHTEPSPRPYLGTLP